MTLGEWLMIHTELTLEQIAQKMDVSRVSLWRSAKGKAVSLNVAKKVSKGTDGEVSLAEILIRQPGRARRIGKVNE